MPAMSVAQITLGVLLGLGIGAAFFGALRRNTRLYFTNAAPALVLHVARFVLASAAFVALATLMPQGLLPALGAFTLAGLVASGRAAGATTP